MVEKMCIFAECDQPQATEINRISTEQLNHLPVNNFDCERDLSVFDPLLKR